MCEGAAVGAKAIRKARELLSELVLLDIGMPGLNVQENDITLRSDVWRRENSDMATLHSY